MTKLYCRLVSALKSEEGTTAVEYALIVAIISVSIITAAGLLSTAIQTTFNSAAAAM